MGINKAEFVISNTDVKKCPGGNLPEYAFIGRSNVGKSSLINMLTNRKSLAKTSQKPGKTQLINHFMINENWYLVDLPGYGYARSSKVKRKEFASIITQYISEREQLSLLFVLLDSRLEPQQIDLDFITRLGEQGIPFALIFTKTDKLKPSLLTKNIANYQKTLLAEWEELPPIFITSAEKAIGRDDVLDYIEEVNRSILSK